MPRDHQLFSEKQEHEVRYFMKKYRVPAKVLRAVIKELKEATGKKSIVSRDEIMIRLYQLNLIKPVIPGPVVPAEWFAQNDLKHETQD